MRRGIPINSTNCVPNSPPSCRRPIRQRTDTLNKFLASDALDAKLAKYVVLLEATPRGLAEFAQQGKEQAVLVEKMLSDADLMKQMLVADGARAKREGAAMARHSTARQ